MDLPYKLIWFDVEKGSNYICCMLANYDESHFTTNGCGKLNAKIYIHISVLIVVTVVMLIFFTLHRATCLNYLKQGPKHKFIMSRRKRVWCCIWTLTLMWGHFLLCLVICSIAILLLIGGLFVTSWLIWYYCWFCFLDVALLNLVILPPEGEICVSVLKNLS